MTARYEGTDAEALREMQRYEHMCWKRLCAMLVQQGALPAADLKRSALDKSTPGCVLLQRIREWGNARAALGPS